MIFSKFCEYLERLEQTSKRLEITEILRQLIEELSPNEIDLGIYLALGGTTAQFNQKQFNIAEKMMVKILAVSFEKSENEIRKEFGILGDLGTVAYQVNQSKVAKNLSISEAHKILESLIEITGTGSQERKIQKVAETLKQLDNLSSKYFVRIVLGTVRLGFTELTIIAALAKLITQDKTNQKEMEEQIEAKYRIHPDIGLIAKNIKNKGINGIFEIEMEVGIPVHAQKAQRLDGPEEIINKMGEVWVEYKFDGTRVQLHMDRKKKFNEEDLEQQTMFEKKPAVFVKTFTRNLEETTHQYPDLVQAAIEQIEADSVILDGEAIGYNPKTGEYLPFQETIQRKRKHDIAETALQIPLKYLVFDLIYLNGKTLVELPLIERRKLLDSIVKKGQTIEIDTHIETDSVEKLSNFSVEALEKGLEGIMVKKINSPYEAGARNFTWVKLKKSKEQILNDSVDCVVLGYYFGKGARANFGIGGFLAGIWDENSQQYKTLTKVGTGLKDEDWEYLKTTADKIKIKNKATNSDINSKYNCDVWVKPNIVVELGADEISKSTEHSAGYALRFPRLIKFRTDKSDKDTTTIEEIEQIFKIQTDKKKR